MKLYIDDERPAPEGWEIVRNQKELINWCLKNGCPDEVSFDHDMGLLKWDGYDCAVWMRNNEFLPSVCYVHSGNPVGAMRIMNFLKDIGLSPVRKMPW